MNYYIAVNAYRSSTSEGFGNTWGLYKCRSRRQQIEVLNRGLPVSDTWYQNRDTGDRSPMYSTLGIRMPYPAERKEANRPGSDHISWIEDLMPIAQAT
jgi:hypothetical protein